MIWRKFQQELDEIIQSDKTQDNLQNKWTRKHSSYFKDCELYIAYCIMTEESDSKGYNEAVKDVEWQRAIEKELYSLKRQETWKEIVTQ